MDFETIIVERKNHIGIITLNRPKELNTFTTTLAGELNQALVDMDQDKEIRVVILKGNGRAFCAGIDVSVLPMKSILEYRQWIREMEEGIPDYCTHAKTCYCCCSWGGCCQWSWPGNCSRPCYCC